MLKPKDYPKCIKCLSDAIKAKRLDLKLSKVELADILKVKPMTIWTWEEKNIKPVPRIMKRIISWLGYVPPLGVDEKTTGGQLYIYRMKQGLTQRDIALSLKMDNFAIVKMENGEYIEPTYTQKIYELLFEE